MPRIDEMWAWVSSDEGGEGVLAAPIPGLGNMPLVGADRARMLSYAGIARQMANMFGVEVKLVRFTTRVDVERITPNVVTADLPPMPEGMPARMEEAITNAAREAARKEHDERPE